MRFLIRFNCIGQSLNSRVSLSEFKVVGQSLQCTGLLQYHFRQPYFIWIFFTFPRQAAVVFGSGYLANAGIIPVLVGKDGHRVGSLGDAALDDAVHEVALNVFTDFPRVVMQTLYFSRDGRAVTRSSASAPAIRSAPAPPTGVSAPAPPLTFGATNTWNSSAARASSTEPSRPAPPSGSSTRTSTASCRCWWRSACR